MSEKYVIMIDGKIGLNGTPMKTENIKDLLNEHSVLKEKIRDAKNCLVCAAIASPIEVCQNTLKILEA